MKPAPRILVAECMQEISSFNPLQSGYEGFHIERGEQMFAQRGLNTSLGGAFKVFDALGKPIEQLLVLGKGLLAFCYNFK